jgi:outer membrane receptor protein involved in Fe transport
LNRYLTSYCSAMALLACAGAAAAQSQEADASSPTTASVEDIVVTASRIDRAGFEAPTPTVRLTAEDLSVGARPNIAAALNDMPQFRATTSPQTTGTNTGAGVAPVDLRGLGVSRTLVLIDGRRVSSDNDLNSIPSVLVKSADVVTGGASAAWGSGAVAGVVNIGLDRYFTGGKLGAEYGLSSYDDAEQARFEGAWGAPFADGRGHFVIGGEYLDNEGVVPKASRPNIGRWATVSIGGETRLTPDVGFANAAYGGLILSGVNRGMAFNSDGSLRTFDCGTLAGTNCVGGEGPSNDDLSPLVTPQQRYAALASATYDIADNLRLTGDVRHSRMWNNYIWFGDHDRGDLTIGIDNAFLSDDIRAQMLAAGETSFRFGRFNSDLSYSTIDFERVTTQATLALDGEFSGGKWRWGAYYSHGEYENNIDTPGFLLKTEFAQAVDSITDPVTGDPICRVALTDPTSTCVPIDLFGLGAPSQEAIDYVTGTPSQRATTKLDVGGVSVRGEPFSLPAGEVSVAFGLEARKESVDQLAGELDRAGAFKTFQFSSMAGEYAVKEAFAEVLVPVVRDLPVLNDLQFNAAARISDYDTTGSIWSWKVGATNEFFPGFRGRITQSRDIRSAGLSEMFTTTTTGWNTINDPANGGQSFYVLNNGGGNPDLTPETADTFTAGFTYAPPSIPGLNLSIDYYNIKIDDVITTIAPQDLVTRCYNGNTALCDKIDRDADGFLVRTRSTYVNLAEYQTDGVDAEVSYSSPADLWVPGATGRMNLHLVGTWVNSLTTDDGVTEIEYVKSQGYSFGLGVPELRVNASLGWKGEVFGANVRARYISPGEYNSTIAIANNHIDAFTYVDLGLTADLTAYGADGVELYANATNLFDKEPPIGSLYSPYYDVIGRYVTVGARYRF